MQISPAMAKRVPPTPQRRRADRDIAELRAELQTWAEAVEKLERQVLALRAEVDHLRTMIRS
jgi:hypothetical protein